MAGWRQTILVGNVGKVDDLKFTSDGKAVLNFTLAVNETWGSGDQKREKVGWHRIAIWGQLAETMAQYIVKGKQVMAIGTEDAKGYIDGQGVAAASLEMTAREIRLLGSKGESSDNGNTEEYAPSSAASDITF